MTTINEEANIYLGIKEKVEDLNKKLVSKTNDLKRANEALQTVEKSIEIARKNYDDIRQMRLTDLDKKESDLKDLEKSTQHNIAENQKTIDKLQNEQKVLNEKISELDTKTSELKRLIQVSDDKLAQIAQKQMVADNDVVKNNSDRNFLEKLTAELETRKRNVEEREKTIEIKMIELSNQEKKFAQIMNELNEKGNEVQKERNQLEQDKQNAHVFIDQAQTEKRIIENFKVAIKETIGNMMNNLRDFQNKAQDLTIKDVEFYISEIYARIEKARDYVLAENVKIHQKKIENLEVVNSIVEGHEIDRNIDVKPIAKPKKKKVTK